MMAGTAVQYLDVNIAAHAEREPFEEIVDQFTLEIAHAVDFQREIDHGVRPSAEIDSSDTERFVHGHDEIAGAVDAATRSECLRHRLAQSDAEVLDRVVLVDIEVPDAGC